MNDADRGWHTAAAMIDRDLWVESNLPGGCDYPRRFLEECEHWGIPNHVADKVLAVMVPDESERIKFWREHAENCYREALDFIGGDEEELKARIGAPGATYWMPKLSRKPALSVCK